MRGIRRARLPAICSTTAIVAAIVLAALPTAAHALPTGTPDPSAFATNGNVNAVARGGGLTYIGGDFTELRAITGCQARLDPTTGRRAAPSPAVPCGTVQASIPDGQGGVYIAGGFSTVGNRNVHRVAHILANGTVDPSFTPPVFLNGVNPGGTVHALALGPDGALYVGGVFTGVRQGGIDYPRGNLAKLSGTSGNIFTTWNPNATHATVTPSISALAVSGSELFVGGLFDNIGGQAREGIAKLSTVSGNAFSMWNPAPVKSDSFNQPQVLALAVSGGELFVGGSFKSIGTLDRNNIAKLSTASGNAFSAWDPDSRQNGSPGTATANALALSDDATALYVGGQFNAGPGSDVDSIGGEPRNRIAKLSASTGNAFSGWNPNADALVRGLAVSGDQVFAAGIFDTIGGLSRPGIAKLSGTSGNAFSLFNVNPRQTAGTAGQLFTVAFSGSRVWAGGTFDAVNNVTRNHIAALDANGVPTSFNPNADGHVNALELSPDATQLFAGGEFTNVGGLDREKVAKLSTASGNAFQTFNAGPVTGVDPNVRAMELSGSNLFVTGGIQQIGGHEPGSLSKLSTSTGESDVAWTPDPTGDVRALEASDDGTVLYAGGAFTAIGGQTHDRLARLSTASGNAFAGWSPSPNGGVNALDLDGSVLYAGGAFTQIGGLDRNRLAKLSTANPGNAFSAWNPDVDNVVNALGVVPGTSVLYAGGLFGGVNGGAAFRNRLAAFSTASGNVFSAFQPQTLGEVFSLAPSATGVAAGQALGGVSFPNAYRQYTEP